MSAETDEERLRRLFRLAGWTMNAVEGDGTRRVDFVSGDGLSSITAGTSTRDTPWEKVFEYAAKDMDRKPRKGLSCRSEEYVCRPYFASGEKCGARPDALAGTGLERAAAAGSAEETALCLCALAGV